MVAIMYIHTYIVGHYNPSGDLVFCTTYVVCVNFIDVWRDMQFKADTEQQVFETVFPDNFIFTLRVFARYLQSPKKYF